MKNCRTWLVLVGVVFLAVGLQAAVVGHWTLDGRSGTQDPLTDSGGATAENASTIYHWATNAGGNDVVYISTWPRFSSDVPAAVGSGQSFGLSDGPYPYAMTILNVDGTECDVYSDVNGSFTVEMYVKFLSIPTNADDRVGMFYGDWYGSWLATSGTGSNALLYARNTDANLPTTYSIRTNEWHHHALVYDGSGATGVITVYVDHTVVATLTHNWNSPTSDGYSLGTFHWRNKPTATRQWLDGFIDEVRISNTALSTNDMMAATVPAFESCGYSDQVMAYGPVAYWRLNETSGKTAFNSANPSGEWFENPGGLFDGFGTGGGSGNVGDTGPRPAGGFSAFDADNYAVNSDGSSTEIIVSDCEAVDITNALTISAWVNPNGTNTVNVGNGIVAKYDFTDGERAYALYLGDDLDIAFVVNSNGLAAGGAYLVTYNAPIPTGTWSHITATFEPSTAMRLYLNGVEVKSTTTSVPATIHNSPEDLRIGVLSEAHRATSTFDGLIDEVVLYDKTLTAAEVLTLYQASFTKGTVVTIK